MEGNCKLICEICENLGTVFEFVAKIVCQDGFALITVPSTAFATTLGTAWAMTVGTTD